MLRLLKPDYRAHEVLVRNARGKAELWRIPLVLAIMMSVYWYGYDLIWRGLFRVMSDDSYRAIHDDFADILLPDTMLVLLFGFGLFWLGLILGLRVVHNRGFESLVGAPAPFWRQSKKVGLGLIGLGLAVWILPPYGFDAPLQAGLRFPVWVSFLAPALIGVLLQTSAEEALFRGYLQQQLAARAASPWVWMVLPSLLFGLAHYAPATYGANAWLVVIWAMVFGLVTSDLTARSGTLGPAITLHFVSNVSAMLVIAPQGEMSGLALYHYGFSAADEAALRAFLPIDFAMIVLSWLVARLALRR